jgi:hypothetical protein
MRPALTTACRTTAPALIASAPAVIDRSETRFGTTVFMVLLALDGDALARGASGFEPAEKRLCSPGLGTLLKTGAFIGPKGFACP